MKRFLGRIAGLVAIAGLLAGCAGSIQAPFARIKAQLRADAVTDDGTKTPQSQAVLAGSL